MAFTIIVWLGDITSTPKCGRGVVRYVHYISFVECMNIEMHVNQACHIYKGYYFFCDVLGSLAAKYCFDFRTERKPHRVYLPCFFFHQTYRHAIINPYLVTRENKGRAGVNVKLYKHGLRSQLFDLVWTWTNECAHANAVKRKVAVATRSFVSFNGKCILIHVL